MESKTVAEREDREDYIQTDIPLDDYRVVVLALTGPPAAGKSTAVKMLRDMGIPCKDTGEAIREAAHDEYDDPNEDQIWAHAELLRDNNGLAAPTMETEDWIKQERAHGHEVVCISSLREQAELEWLRENVGPTLCVRVEATRHDRTERYLSSKLENDEVVSTEEEQSIKEEIVRREEREKPYPQHDVQIENPNSTGMRDFWQKLDNVVEVMGA